MDPRRTSKSWLGCSPTDEQERFRLRANDGPEEHVSRAPRNLGKRRDGTEKDGARDGKGRNNDDAEHGVVADRDDLDTAAVIVCMGLDF